VLVRPTILPGSAADARFPFHFDIHPADAALPTDAIFLSIIIFIIFDIILLLFITIPRAAMMPACRYAAFDGVSMSR